MPTRELIAPADLGADLLTVVARLNRMATQQSALPMPYAQARLLAQIEQQGPSRISELAAADHCSQPTMTTQVQRLEAGGWVERRGDPSDARAVLVSVTPAGTADPTGGPGPCAPRWSCPTSDGWPPSSSPPSPTPSRSCATCSTTCSTSQHQNHQPPNQE